MKAKDRISKNWVTFVLLCWLSGTLVGEETTSLPKMQAKIADEPTATLKSTYLERDWIGDIRDGQGGITHLRLEKGSIRDGKIFLMRTSPEGGYVGTEAPEYLEKIPTNAKFEKIKTVDGLVRILGKGEPGFDGEPSDEGSYSFYSWVVFGRESDSELIYLYVDASTFLPRGKSGNASELVKNLEISRGVLRPADPSSREESDKYLTGKKIYEMQERDNAAAREAYPQPLRNLIEVRDQPGSDLGRLTTAINAIRSDPDPLLFRQLAAEIHEGTVRMRMLLEKILLDNLPYLKAKPWDKKKKEIAVLACIDALPDVEARAQINLVVIILSASGGGKIEIEGKDGTRSVEVRNTESGHSYTLSAASDPLSMSDGQVELKRIFLKSISDE